MKNEVLDEGIDDQLRVPAHEDDKPRRVSAGKDGFHWPGMKAKSGRKGPTQLFLGTRSHDCGLQMLPWGRGRYPPTAGTVFVLPAGERTCTQGGRNQKGVGPPRSAGPTKPLVMVRDRPVNNEVVIVLDGSTSAILGDDLEFDLR